jgi:SUKH-3 immunity protein
MLPWSHLSYVEEWQPGGGEPAQRGRFPDAVAEVLADAGWNAQPDFVGEGLAGAMIEEAVDVRGQEHVHVPFPAVTTALADFPGLTSGRRAPGTDQWIRVFQIEPTAAAHSADILAEFGAVLGVRLFPIGTEARGETILAIDEHGRVFALDQAGEWFIGADIDTALIILVTGGPTFRVRDDGTW